MEEVKRFGLIEAYYAQIGVSTALVSYVLNNQKQGRIGKEIAEKKKNLPASSNVAIRSWEHGAKVQMDLTAFI